MTLQIVSAAHPVTGRSVRRLIGRGILVGIGAGLGAISVSAYGLDLAVGYSRTVVTTPHSAPAGRRSIPAHPVDLVDPPPNRSVLHAQLVDRLYEELMHSSGCAVASRNASIVGGC